MTCNELKKIKLIKKSKSVTDRQTDRPTDGWTDYGCWA